MPAISKIRFTNVIYENGGKRFNDDLFDFDGENAAILLENGGGKTVFVQTALQAVLPHYNTEERKIRETLSLEGGPCHIGIEWILQEKPRRYVVTAVTLFIHNNKLESFKYVYEYGEGDNQALELMPFVIRDKEGKGRPADKGEISDYYQSMQAKTMSARLFMTIKEYQNDIESNYKIIPSEWRSIGKINGEEGGVEGYFSECKNTKQLVERLLIPVVEEALAEGGSEDFVEAFEKQRERFKQHKQLRERIKESQTISQKIEEYVSVFQTYDKKEKAFFKEKSYAKALYEHLLKDKEQADEALNQANIQGEKLKERKQIYEQKTASLEIEKLKQACKSSEEQYQEAGNIYTLLSQKLKEKQLFKDNLEIAKLKEEEQVLNEKIRVSSEQIQSLENTLDLETIRISMGENQAKLKGYFQKEERVYLLELQKNESERESNEEACRAEEREIQALERKKGELNQLLSKKEGKLEALADQLTKARKKIADFNPNETAENQQIIWANRIADIQNILAKSTSAIKKIEHELLVEGQSKEEIQQKLQGCEKALLQLKTAIQNYYTAEEKLLNQLKPLDESWYLYDSIYKREASICNYLEHKIEWLRNEKELSLKEERLAMRYLDEYGILENFSVDPLIGQWVNKWQSKFTFIEQGIQYFQRAVETLTDKTMVNTGAWAASIIVKKEELEALKALVEPLTEQLKYPIYLITLEEARALLAGQEEDFGNVYFPKHWSENLDSNEFQHWKEMIQLQGEALKLKREKIEKEMQNFFMHLRETQKFIANYPYEQLKRLEEDLEHKQLEVSRLTFEYQGAEKQIHSLENQYRHHMEEKSKCEDEEKQLERWIEAIHDYILTERHIRDLERECNRIHEQIPQIEKDSRKHQRSHQILGKRLEDIQGERDELSEQLNKLRLNPYYAMVQGLEPLYSDWTLEGLISHFESLKQQYEMKQGDLGLLIEKKQDLKKQKEKVNIALRGKCKEINGLMDENLSFSLYGEEKIEMLRDEILALRPQLEESEAEKNRWEGEYIQKKNLLEVKMADYDTRFSALIIFEEALESISDELKREKIYLREATEKNKQITEKLTLDAKNIEKIKAEFEVLNGRYAFLQEGVDRVYLEQSQLSEFSYQRALYLDKVNKNLEKLGSQLLESHSFLKDYQIHFIYDCESFIQDAKLKEQTVVGIKQKQRLEEVLEWQRHMQSSLNHIIQVKEADMREHDKDLEQYVSHLHVYLRTVVEELAMIPKKTRIKVEDQWKDIFEFQIPSWQEDEGKQAIRRYIDQMLQHLDRDTFKNIDGTEMQTGIHAEIGKWLEINQLLPIVMKSNMIKIKCRKVTNDKKISSRSVSWEESNKWSGGEKWSKNMTLFLGILNYIAERRQGIGMEKSHRTVIVDNPFGKASSDHVLDPVFYIAEKLGFQIIALTAHAEGSFIRSYFPVVYSCRLREAVDNRTMIMEKVREIKHLFLKDHLPDLTL